MFCDAEKAWLSQKGIPFTMRDVAQDQTALDELAKMEVYSTPVTLIDGEVVVGFNRKRMAELLGVEA
jgi:glutaredoxin